MKFFTVSDIFSAALFVIPMGVILPVLSAAIIFGIGGYNLIAFGEIKNNFWPSPSSKPDRIVFAKNALLLPPLVFLLSAISLLGQYMTSTEIFGPILLLLVVLSTGLIFFIGRQINTSGLLKISFVPFLGGLLSIIILTIVAFDGYSKTMVIMHGNQFYSSIVLHEPDLTNKNETTTVKANIFFALERGILFSESKGNITFIGWPEVKRIETNHFQEKESLPAWNWLDLFDLHSEKNENAENTLDKTENKKSNKKVN